jgi:hypothetical protein
LGLWGALSGAPLGVGACSAPTPHPIGATSVASGDDPTLTADATQPLPPMPQALRPPADLDVRAHGWLFDKGRRPVLTGWEDKPEQLRAAYCQGCHPQSHADWAADIHARAWTDPLFTEAFRKETKLWCVHCHAPLAAQRRAYDRLVKPPPYVLSEDGVDAAQGAPDASVAPDAPYPGAVSTAYAPTAGAWTRASDQALLDEGINCAGCHVRNGQILGSRPSRNDAHPVTPTDYLSSAQFCGECHQFNFPSNSKGVVTYSNAPMQNTLIEWQDADPGVTCLGCHAQPDRPHRTYGPHDPDWMRARFPAPSLSWPDPQTLEVALKIPARGHRVPSGDLFHSLALEASATADFTKPTTQQTWRRLYKPTRAPLTPNGPRRHLAEDTTLAAEAQHLTTQLSIPDASGPLFIRLVYRYHDERLGGRHPLPFDQKSLVLWQTQAR